MKRFCHFALLAGVLALSWMPIPLAAQMVRFNYAPGARQTARQGSGVQPATSVRGGFTPAALAGLDLWLDAGQIMGLSDGASVSTWPEVSGNGRHASQAVGAKRPAYKATAGPNNTACVRFDGAQTFLDTPAFSTFPTKRGTVLIVMKCGFASGYRVPLSIYDGTGVGWQVVVNLTGTKYKWYDTVGDRITTSADSTAAFQLQCFNRTGDTTLEFRRNAVLESTFTIANNQPDSKVLQAGAFSNSGGSNYFQGDIALILVYSRSLSAAELAQLEAWINQRFALY